MGYFSMPMKDTKEDHIKSIRTNAELWAERPDADHLLCFIQGSVEWLEQHLKEEHERKSEES